MSLPSAPPSETRRLTPRAIALAGAMLGLAVAWKIAVVDRLPPPPAPAPAAPAQPPARVLDENVIASGVIAGSMAESAERVGATPAVTAEMVELFAHRLDFQRDLKTGDRFRLIFARTVTDRGLIVAAGQLDYAELAGLKLYRFVRDDGGVGYFDGSGQGARGFLLRTPVYGARITSRFGLRQHPILGYTRAHQGIDFAAPTGTPIQAAGDGVVAEAGPWGGYGNWLRIRHGGGWDTGYGHISRFAAGIGPGAQVRQGQVVAYVGATGLATGPHLHYEIWSGGQRVDPMGVKAPQGVTLAGAELARFQAQAARIDGRLAGQAQALAGRIRNDRPH